MTPLICFLLLNNVTVRDIYWFCPFWYNWFGDALPETEVSLVTTHKLLDLSIGIGIRFLFFCFTVSKIPFALAIPTYCKIVFKLDILEKLYC